MNVFVAIHTVTERVDGKSVMTKAGNAFVPQEVNIDHFLKCGAIRRASEAEAALYNLKNPPKPPEKPVEPSEKTKVQSK